jgi:two-component system NtrC family response regulator
LIAEGQRPLAQLWATELERLVEATLAHSLEEARARLSGRAFDVMLLDISLPDESELDLLREITERGDDTAVIVLADEADLESAKQALRLGAYAYLIKPCRIVELEQHLKRLADEQVLRNENLALCQQIESGRGVSSELIGSSPPLTAVRRLIAKIAVANVPVLITGEAGTGKGVASRMIHAQSARSEAAYVVVNCAAMLPELLESELFGHRKGAFTGADRDHRGLVAAASSGTLFLDKIDDLPLEVQPKLLRLLENGEAQRVGDTEAYHVDVRVVAATDHDLRRDIETGRFRRDLFNRLATAELNLPSLRDIADDIPAIAEHLLHRHRVKVPASQAQRFSAPAMHMLKHYPWPGNVRELRNVVERAKILCNQAVVMPEHLNLLGASLRAPFLDGELFGTMAEVERMVIDSALKRNGGNKTAAARTLGISLRTLYNKMASHTRKPRTNRQ